MSLRLVEEIHSQDVVLDGGCGVRYGVDNRLWLTMVASLLLNNVVSGVRRTTWVSVLPQINPQLYYHYLSTDFGLPKE